MVFVAGNFIYIGADIWQHLLRNEKFCENIMEIVMFAVGFTAMLAVLELE